MIARYVWSNCEWHENDKWTEQLDLALGGVNLVRELNDAWCTIRRSSPRVEDKQLAVIVDLASDGGPVVEAIYGYIPGRYVEMADVIGVKVEAAKNKLVSYVLQASLSEALKRE